MNPIRPNFPLPVAQPRPVRPEAKAAQRAFFQAATPQAAPGRTAASTSSAEQVRAAAATARATADNPEQPTRYLRPGSLVDIKV